MLHYVCSIQNKDAGGGLLHQLFALTWEQVEAFAKRENGPGRGVFICANPLEDGATSRSLDTVLELRTIYFDLDIQHLNQSYSEVMERLRQLPFKFSRVIDSGNGNIHTEILIKDPPARGTPEYERGVALWKRLTDKLCADPAPAHPAALRRLVGTSNTKFGQTGTCRVLWGDGEAVDLTKIEALDDLLERPLFTWKGTEKPASSSSYDHAEERRGPIDVDARLASMRLGGKGDSAIDITRRDVCASMMAQSISVTEIVSVVLDATRRCVADNPDCANWKWLATDPGRGVGGKSEEQLIWESCFGWAVKHPDKFACLLPDNLRLQLEATLAEGKRPKLSRNGHGWHVRGYTENEETISVSEGEPAEAPPSSPQYRFRLISFQDMRPGLEPVYLVDELIPSAGLVLVWGKQKTFKSFWLLDLMLYVALGWPYRDRAVRQGAVIYCAFEGAHGYKGRIEALRRHYQIGNDAAVPLYVMPGQADLITDERRLITDFKAQLSETTPIIVVLDTLNRSLKGSENSDEDMTKYTRAAEAIRNAFGCVVLIVHHCGYDDTHSRGHTSLPAAVDAELSVTRQEGSPLVQVTVKNMRDGPEGMVVRSRAQTVSLEADQNGRPRTSIVVVPDDSPVDPRQQGRPDVAYPVLLSALRQALAADGTQFHPEGKMPVRAVAESHVRARFYKSFIDAEDDAKKSAAAQKVAFSRAVKKAIAGGGVCGQKDATNTSMLWFASAEENYR